VNVTSQGVISGQGWRRIRVQLGGGLLIALLPPFAVATLVRPDLIGKPLFLQSFLAVFASVAGGYYLFRSLTRFPGIQAGYYVLPAFSSSFAVAVTALFMLRLEYSRSLLIASFLLCLGWYYLVYFRAQRSPNIRIGVVPYGDVASLWDIEAISCERLSTPAMPTGCSAIVADFRASMPDEWEAFLADAALGGMSVLHVKQLRESLTGQVQIEHLSENSSGSLVPQAAFTSVKSVIDRVIAVVVLLVVWPVLLIVALTIRLTSPGPALFRQRRIGYRGHPFYVWKFRTMAHRPPATSSDTARADAITLANDDRITPLGRILRRTRLDELPQLVNVCRGQMSFIGPRPEADVLSHWYQQELPFYRYRHIVRPGITGWAQVNQGHVAEVDEVHHKLHYDFYYISNFSFWLDVLILIRTVKTMITGFGSK
jgi:lipopolysaccharide/colanic/teichoic acid biosynthesis glycosyltransferase